MNIKKYKQFVLLVLCGIIFFFFYLLFKPTENYELDDFEIGRIDKDNLVYNVTINSNNSVYSYECNCIYLPSKAFLDKFNFKVYSNYKVRYFVQENDDEYYLNVFSNDYYERIPVNFTGLPIVNIFDFEIEPRFKIDNSFLDEILNKNTESDVSKNVGFQILYEENGNLFIKNSSASLSVRGSSSSVYEKKPYKIKFHNDISIFDMTDDIYALDALMTDRSKVRNLLSSNLWDLMNDNQIINNDLNGYFFEMFMNNSYYGLYSIKNKVNSNNLSLRKNGVLLKSVAHIRQDYIDQLLLNNFSIDDDGYFLNYQVKEYNKKTFDLFIKNMQDYYRYNSYDSISRNFYIDNYLNYYIFVSLISGSDNVSYNRYFSMMDSDSKILITPWDMDLTWGLNWSDNAQLHSVFSMDSSSDVEWMEKNIVSIMDDKTFEALRKRYWELRRDVITVDTINNYLDSYKVLLVDGGAVSRDSNRWYAYNVENEIESIREWAIRRIEFLDEYFK